MSAPEQDLPFTGPSGPADDRAPTTLARRVGPPVAVVSLAVTALALLWMAFGGTDVVGPLSDAPFTVDARLVYVDGEGCAQLHTTAGDSSTVCSDAAMQAAEDRVYVEAFFTADGSLAYGPYDDIGLYDPATGDRIGAVPDADDQRAEPLREPGYQDEGVWARDGVVVTQDDSEEVVLDLGGPPGYGAEQVVLSPDGMLLVVQTTRGEIVVAPRDGSAGAYRWLDLDRQDHVDLYLGIDWS